MLLVSGLRLWDSNWIMFSDDAGPLEGTVSDDQLRVMLKTQLEYYFSR